MGRSIGAILCVACVLSPPLGAPVPAAGTPLVEPELRAPAAPATPIQPVLPVERDTSAPAGALRPVASVGVTPALFTPPTAVPSATDKAPFTPPSPGSSVETSAPRESRPVPPAPASPPGKGVLKVHFIDVGHGDSCLIQTPRGNSILIDGGNFETSRALVQYLKNAGVKRIALLIATHPHSDHVGGLPAVVRAFEVDTVLDPGKNHPSYSYREFLKAVESSKKTRYVIARAGQSYRVDDVRIAVLAPADPLPDDVNDCSIVCRASYGDFSMMLPGDAGVDAEKNVLKRRGGPLKSTLLKVGHHGSKTSTSTIFLRAVLPEVAVISCKERKSGRWAPNAVHTLKARGIRMYRTDHDGTVIIESDGKGYTVRTLDEGLDEEPSRD